jgi:ferredoxin--NADP+ reductase
MPGMTGTPLRIAVIGSGPSAFYATEALFKADGTTAQVDMFDRLPTPFGLVRGGVAPDHQKIKSVSRVYDKVATNAGFRFFGNVKIGRDLSVEDLESHYHMVVWAIGCESDNKLGVPGQDLAGVHSATEFVGWYNGHPDFRDRQFDLANSRTVVVIGNGNVAMDVSRILLRDIDELAETDIADHAVAALRQSNVEQVVLLGRRGPAQAAFSPKEIEEIDALADCDVVVSPEDGKLDDYSRTWVESQPRSAQRNVAFLTAQADKGEGTAAKKLRCRFLVSPVGFAGDGKVQKVRIQHAELQPDGQGTPRPKAVDRFEEIDADLVFAAIGYRGVPLAGLAYDDRKGIVANDDGRVLLEPSGEARRGHYVVGWAKRGPTGLVGTNSPDSKETVALLLADAAQRLTLQPTGQDVRTVLDQRGVDAVSWDDWLRLDQWERDQGAARGKCRHKQVSVEELMATIRSLRSSDN